MGKKVSKKDVNGLDSLIGKKYFFRAVTYHVVGKVVGILHENILKIEGASWIAESGRFMQAIKNGELSEIEPVGDVYLNLDTVVDFYPWKHELPTEQK